MTDLNQVWAAPMYLQLQGAYASLGFARSPAEWRNLAIIAGTIGSALGVNWVIKKVRV